MADSSNKGTDNHLFENSAWFLDQEAECIDTIDSFEELFDVSAECSNISELIDDENECEQGNSLALYNEQITQECNKAIADLKRKYTKTPPELQTSVAALSPRLEAIRISPDRTISSKRRLCFQDSGYIEDETSNSDQVDRAVNTHATGAQDLRAACQEIFLSSNKRAKLLTKFQDFYGVPYSEITRCFKSNKTMSDNWVVSVFAAACEVIEGSKHLLKQHCDFIQCIQFDFSALYLLKFKHAKNRETVNNLFCNLLNVQDYQLICDPPKSRSVAAALYFYKQGIMQNSFKYGTVPEWVARQTTLNHQIASQAESFELSKMVQWAYDNHIIEEPEIAYYYALQADEDSNAAAFLKSNSQPKYVKDCSYMVKLYLRQEMKNMTMSEWIFKCCRECEKTGNWKTICNLLKFQNVNIIAFLSALRLFLKGKPKKNCICIYGIPDSGKSYFCYSLVKFLRGKVVSYLNKNSNFWLQPMLETKIGFLDDATRACWTYMDIHMRNALDGNAMCIDAKYKAPQQHKLPPFLVTSNENIFKEDCFKYLHSRVTGFEFPNRLPLDNDGNPIFVITDQDWKSFFLKLTKQLDLQENEDESERPDKTFRCTAEQVDDSV
ncbi:E1 [Gammapapillomavirus 11]|uniref:Replication protein E1 n=1 Tax=Gammapapillomavirus 11 TaxID=1513256 RepID=A0A2D2ALQ6_9PAPI|nr:E1 [Gammapapillomavirus 11]